MSTKLIIRQVEPSDEQAIARLWQALSDYHVEIDSRLPPPTPGAAERYAERLIERRHDPQTQAFVAEIGGRVVGYVLGAVIDLHPDLFQHVDSGFIADIFVQPAYRKNGIARLLVDTINEWFARQGVHRTELQVAAANIEGIRFWEAVGGQPIMIRMRMENGE